MILALYDNKSVYRNRETKEEAERALKIKQTSRPTENTGCWSRFKNVFKDLLASLTIKTKYVFVPVVKVLPSVMFRLGTMWLLFTYSSEWFPNREGNGPGYGLLFPLGTLCLIFGINYVVGKKSLDCKENEAIVNSISNLVLPAYVDLEYLVS